MAPYSVMNDSDGNRTRVTAVKGRCLNRLTTEPDYQRNRLAPRAGLEPATPRLTAACNKYHETNDLLLVKAFLGHRQVAMTEQYTGNLNVIG